MIRTQKIILSLILAVALPLPLRAAPREASSNKKNLVLTLSLTGAAAGAFLADRSLRRPAGSGEYAGRGGVFKGEHAAFDTLGTPTAQFGLAGAFYAAGWATDSEQARRVGGIGAAALVTNGLATWGLKSAVGRSRPFTNKGPSRWNGGSGYANASFPSGHTSMAFTMAAVVAEEYESPVVDFLSYGLAGAVGATRIYQDQHWTSDVVAGAALGLLVGKGISRWERRGGWAKFIYTDGRGLYFRVPF